MKKFISIKKKITKFNKIIIVDGDKSISIRSLIFASLATGKSKIKNLLESEDVLSAVNCLKVLGVKINKKKNHYLVKGVGINKFNPFINKMFLSGRSEDVTDDMKKFAEESGVIFMCVSEEKGHWGSFSLEDNFDPKKLVPKIVCPNIGIYSECLYGFLYDGKSFNNAAHVS